MVTIGKDGTKNEKYSVEFYASLKSEIDMTKKKRKKKKKILS